jgi:Holliday junction DNA helicase RuvA
VIASIQGTLVSASPLRVVVELNGIGYEVNVPLTTTERLPLPGASVKLHTLAIYREDSQSLYGFASAAERDFFRMMVDHVKGVGPKNALGIMSHLSLALLESAIRAGDVAMLAKCRGIGRKTAEQLVVDLKDRIGGSIAPPSPGASASEPGGDSHHRDAVAALVALGYKTSEADQSVRRATLALGPAATTEALIKKALG